MSKRTPSVPCVALLVVLMTFLVSPAFAANVKTLEVGSPAPDFKLPGVDGKTYSLADFKGAKLLLVLFTCNHCPTAQAYEDRVKQIQADYKDKGLALVAINPNDPSAVRLDELGYTDLSDSFDEMKLAAKERGFAFPYLYDGETQRTSLAYGVQATPHCFLFDADRKLRYVGRIDDSEVKTVKSQDLRNAIDALLAGKEVAVPKTNVFGCSTKWKEKAHTLKEEQDEMAAQPVSLSTIDAAGVKAVAANAGADAPKVRVINVWATWCGPCVKALPGVIETVAQFPKDRVKLVGVNQGEPADTVKGFLEAHDWPLSVAMDMQQSVARQYGVDGIPHTVVVGPNGKVAWVKSGYSPDGDKELARAIEQLLGGGAKAP
jgi:peroxiredoxin